MRCDANDVNDVNDAVRCERCDADADEEKKAEKVNEEHLKLCGTPNALRAVNSLIRQERVQVTGARHCQRPSTTVNNCQYPSTSATIITN